MQNVIFLIDDEDPKKFYPRIELMKTTSFQELDYGQQRIIQDIYYEYSKKKMKFHSLILFKIF